VADYGGQGLSKSTMLSHDTRRERESSDALADIVEHRQMG
jgi:hypothetical protein